MNYSSFELSVMAYEHYSVKDFLLDDFFNKWVREPDIETSVYWEKWLAAHPDKRKLITQAKATVLALSSPGKQLSLSDKELIWEAINKRRAGGRDRPQFNGQIVRKRNSVVRFNLFKAAAAVVLLVALGGISFYLLNRSQTVRYATKYGEVKKIVLPDRSVVILNANSSISFEAPWKDHRPREVTLRGEAYFQITRTRDAPKRKFIVHADRLKIEDLSTQFDVNNRRDKVKIVLREGSVRLVKPTVRQENGLLMEPGDLVVYDMHTSTFQSRKVNPDQFISWKDGTQIFKETPLSEVAQTIEDTYGWKFSFANEKLKRLQFTGRFEANDISDFLIILSKSFDLNVSRNNDKIIIKKE